MAAQYQDCYQSYLWILKNTNKHYKSMTSTSAIETINDKAKTKTNKYPKTNFKTHIIC